MPAVKNIEMVLITKEHSDNPTSLPVYQAYLEGALSVQQSVNLAGTASYVSLEQNGNHPDFTSLQVRTYPTILFVDDATGTTLVRIEGSRITPNAVAAALLEIDGWERDEVGNYLDADGKKIAPGGNGVFSVLPGNDGLNFGLRPLQLPKALWWILTGVGVYYTAGARNQAQKYLIGGVTVYAASKALAPSGSLGQIAPPSLGKLTDLQVPIKPGSRVDDYWNGRISIDLSLFGNRETQWLKKLDVSGITSHFKLHSAEFGNWVNQAERYQALYGVAVSLADLAKVLNVPQNRLGFGKSLAIAYGARGKGGRAMATYHPSIHLINLTKTAGEGALAHEYGHAIDFQAAKKLGFPPSGGRSTSKRIEQRKGGSLPALFEKVFEALYWDDGQPTDFYESIIDMPAYWQYRAEVWARLFEAWVSMRLDELGIKNEFLVGPAFYKAKEYPRPALIRKAEPYIRQIITKVIGR
jgi:hypothetical protein